MKHNPIKNSILSKDIVGCHNRTPICTYIAVTPSTKSPWHQVKYHQCPPVLKPNWPLNFLLRTGCHCVPVPMTSTSKIPPLIKPPILLPSPSCLPSSATAYALICPPSCLQSGDDAHTLGASLSMRPLHTLTGLPTQGQRLLHLPVFTGIYEGSWRACQRREPPWGRGYHSFRNLNNDPTALLSPPTNERYSSSFGSPGARALVAQVCLRWIFVKPYHNLQCYIKCSGPSNVMQTTVYASPTLLPTHPPTLAESLGLHFRVLYLSHRPRCHSVVLIASSGAHLQCYPLPSSPIVQACPAAAWRTAVRSTRPPRRPPPRSTARSRACLTSRRSPAALRCPCPRRRSSPAVGVYQGKRTWASSDQTV